MNCVAQTDALKVHENVLILGVGNTLCGDDGAGPQLIKLLSNRDLPPGVHLKDAGLPGWGLPSFLDGWDSVFLVDAVEMGVEPGSWRCFRSDQVKLLLKDECLSLHQPDLACGLALAEALDLLPKSLHIYGVQPAQIEPGTPLSPQVIASLSGLADQIITDIGNNIE